MLYNDDNMCQYWDIPQAATIEHKFFGNNGRQVTLHRVVYDIRASMNRTTQSEYGGRLFYKGPSGFTLLHITAYDEGHYILEYHKGNAHANSGIYLRVLGK